MKAHSQFNSRRTSAKTSTLEKKSEIYKNDMTDPNIPGSPGKVRPKPKTSFRTCDKV
jgi:hypothetical protein